MCSIAGLVCFRELKAIEVLNLFHKFTNMLVSGQDRGMDATGIVHLRPGQEPIEFKADLSADKFVTTPKFIDTMQLIGSGSIIITNNRAQPLPEGDSMELLNRQPVRYKDLFITHNGTISNDRDIENQYMFKKDTQIDSEVVLRLWEHYGDLDINDKIKKVCSEISGGIAVAIAEKGNPYLYLMKNFKPLWIAYYLPLDILIFNSELKNIEQGFGQSSVFGPLTVEWIPPFTAVKIDSINGALEYLDIQTKTLSSLPETDNDKALVICSGGIDSSTAATVAAKIHNKKVMLLHFNYGQTAHKRELIAVDNIAKSINATVMDIDIQWMSSLCKTPLTDSEDKNLPLGIDSVESTKCWVPARNLIMLSISAGIAEAQGYKYIYSGFNLEESGAYPDNDIEMFQTYNRMLNYGTIKRIQLKLVLERFMKTEILKLGTHLGVPYEHTWSCDRGGEIPCGECGCCWTRRHAFIKAGLEDKQTYQKPLPEQAVWLQSGKFKVKELTVEEMLEKLKNDNSG